MGRASPCGLSGTFSVGRPLYCRFLATQASRSLSVALLLLSVALRVPSHRYLNVDGIYQATRTSLQAGKARWAEVRGRCAAKQASLCAE